MSVRFPKFSQGLAQDPTTRRVWFGIATSHDVRFFVFCILFNLLSIIVK